MIVLVYMTLFRWIDYTTCVSSMARRVNAPTTIEGIEKYILGTASPGTNREDVLRILGKLGPVQVRFQSKINPVHEIRDTIFIKSCMHPLNNLEIYAFYNLDGELISLSLLNDD